MKRTKEDSEMTAFELIQIFEDTQNTIFHTPELFDEMLKSQCGSQLFLEGYTSPLRVTRGPERKAWSNGAGGVPLQMQRPVQCFGPAVLSKALL